MKKYRRILAGFLAMNLTISGMLAEVPSVSANEGNYDESSAQALEEIQEYSAEEANTAESFDNETSMTENISESDEVTDIDGTEESTDTEVADIITDNEESETSEEEISWEEEQILGEGETEETESESETEETSVQSSVATYTGDITLEQFYTVDENGKKSITIGNAKALILLSNCNPKEIQNITINLNITGGSDITKNTKIEAGEDISTYFNNGSTLATASVEEGTQGDENAEDLSQSSQSDTELENSDAVKNSEVEDSDVEEQNMDTSAQSDEVQTESMIASQEYTFQGIGSAEDPFQGTITGQNIPLRIDRPFFGGLSSVANISVGNSKLQLTWCGDKTQAMIAEVYQFDSSADNGHTLPVIVSRDDSKGTTAVMGSLIDTVKATSGYEDEILNISKDNVTYNGEDSSEVAVSSNNAGLICNTLESGNICLDNYDFPTDIDKIESTAEYQSGDASKSGNVGSFIGAMGKNTSLEIKTPVTIPAALEIKSENGNAGGLVGLMQQGAKIITDVAVSFTSPQISGGTSAGGVAGAAEDAIFADSDMPSTLTITGATIKGTKTDANAGGFIGTYTLNADKLDNAESLKLPDKINIDSPKLTVNQSNTGLAGGFFGLLVLNGTLTYNIGGADADAKKEMKPTYQDCSVKACGAIAGQVTSSNIASTLLIQNIKTSATNGAGSNYHGGLIGEVGTADGSKPVYLEVSNVEITESAPQANDSEKNGFGGLAGCLGQGSILKTTGIVTISTSGDINRGGGVVGYADKSVINIAGTTDLSGTTYENGTGKAAKTGWLVGYQNCALIYANGDGNGNGWTYIRGKENTSGKQAMNDIGNYGQIIRLHAENSKSKLSSDLIEINNDHEVKYKVSVDGSGSLITLGSEDAFALLSIAWNSRGYFGGVTGITSNNFSSGNPKSKNITLDADMDLTGSGIAGLSRDTYSDDDTYAGTFDGNSKTITLAIGETFGFKQSDKNTLASAGDDGYGEVISAGEQNPKLHGRQGLFAVIGTATIQNLTIAGNIYISNAGKDILAGGIAGEIHSSGKPKCAGVTVEETITGDCAINQNLVVGGFYGGNYSYSEPSFGEAGKKDTLNTAAATICIINSTSSTDDSKINAGGIIGEIGESSIKITINNLDVKGSITTDAQKRAYVGGLVGIVKGNNGSANHTINMKNVAFDGFTIAAPNAIQVCGGLLGSIWAQVNLCIESGEETNASLVVKNNTGINAPNAEFVGGLAYRSSGKWEIQDYGIDLENLTINAKKDVGLLVCKGTLENDNVAGSWRALGALYLSITKHWERAYKIVTDSVNITTADNSGVFDEFVAYTALSASQIMDNDTNGVISIATQENENGRVGVDTSGCTTYQNRTAYGKTHKTNACSRYYYDLDQCIADVGNSTYKDNGKIDTEQELLLWSVYNYAETQIKTYVGATWDIKTASQDTDGNSLPWTIGGTKPLDMTKYSYYPIKFSNGSVTVRNTEITFDNEQIETAEKNASNKSTQGIADDHTQHYTMHCGLFLTYTSGNGTLEVNTVTFSGNIGKVNNSNSGVLVANYAYGHFNGSRYMITINLQGITFKGLKVNDCGNDYAPLLINNIGNFGATSGHGYATVNVDGVKTEGYTPGTAVASSLIGTVGSASANEINLSFLHIKLPDRKADGANGIFSHATLLESYAYSRDDSASGATYNFYREDDWKDGENKYNVTYGNEITETKEFRDLQKWYYNEATHRTDDGLVYEDANNKYGFNSSGYLPYVCTAHNEDKCTHEIKVNQRVTNIINGCGTYSHPYRITTEAEMTILAEYMASGQPRKDWRVTVSGAPNGVHTATSETDYSSDQDVIYQYDGNQWVQVENKATDETDNWQPVAGDIKLSKGFMLDYLLNAYYDIRGTVQSGDTNGISGEQLTLKNFAGFGTVSQPFRGVITSTNGTTLVLSGDGSLIPYSYGSVVKNLKIIYVKEADKGKTLKYNDTTNTKYYPNVCFGGVIGCVLGGDNIIDSVTVTVGKGYLTLSGDKKHLIQVGGYVGSVSGGGVIFRNIADNTGLSNNAISNAETEVSVAEEAYYSMYVNPYVGRVLDGFAFYEADSADRGLTNGSKNYNISTIVPSDTADDVTISDNAVTVNDAQGLLILSAIVNSGGASNGISDAYSKMGNSSGKAVQYTTSTTSDNKVTYSFGGKYGKVRNASYNVGNTWDDATLSKNEDQMVTGDGNLPYLIQKYCRNNVAIFSVSANSDIEINLSANMAGFDMTGYANGYQGIGGRYVSNAIRGRNVNTSVMNHPEGIIPEVKNFNGNSKPVTMTMQVREYTDDDFHAASVGGIFNVLRISFGGGISNVTVGKDGTASDISLIYYGSNGQPADVATNDWAGVKDVGAGGLAGSLVGYTDENGNRDTTMQTIQMNSLTITSPGSAGGTFGNTGKPTEYTSDDRSNITDIAAVLQPKNSQLVYGIAFNDCSYKDIHVTGKYASGGFVGYLGNTDQNPRSSVNGNGFNGTLTRNMMGEGSTISATDSSSWAGGLFGYVGTRMFINMTDEGAKNDINMKANLQNVAVSAGTAVGGCIGYINGKCYGIHNVTVKGTGTTALPIAITLNTTGIFYAGGIVGYAKGNAQGWTPNWTYAGGIISSSIENVQINNANMATNSENIGTGGIQTNYIAGGMVGQVEGGKTRIESCTANASKIYGSVSAGMTGQTDSWMEFVNCTVTGTSELAKTEIQGFSTAGGILGFWTGGNAATIQGCSIQYLNIEDKDWGAGALVGDADGGGVGTLYLFHTSVKDSDVTALGNSNDAGGRWPCVGTIIGNLRNTIKASNILISGVTLNAEKGKYSPWTGAPKGLLFGNVIDDSIAVNIAGISIQDIPDANKDWDLAGSGSVTSDNDYIAFADYSGTATDISDASLAGKSIDLLGYTETVDEKSDEIQTNVSAPYVVTSPKGTLKLYDSETAQTARYPYGDGVSWTDTGSNSFTVEAQEIYKNKGSVTDGHYAYKNITIESVESEADFDLASMISTFSANQTAETETDSADQTESEDTSQDSSQTTQNVKDFPVVQIGSGSDDVITDYLNILTNGAFTAANNMNTADSKVVTARTDVYEYKDGKFVKSNPNDIAFKVNVSRTGQYTFATTTGYDNGKNRFNLLTVTFKEKDADGKEYRYNVFVPILVRRMLEMDFTATLTYGTDFNSADYQDLTNHVLESFGSSITGYLTYTYSSAEGVYADYGWESYINAGGDLTEMKKSIRFATTASKLPKGTQMTLVDVITGRAYYYEATGTEVKVNNAGFDIPLGKFKNSDDEAYQEPSISELIKAVAIKGGSNPLFIQVDANGAPVNGAVDGKTYAKPTVKIKETDKDGKEEYKYYRLADSDETGTHSITVNESNLKETNNNKTTSKVMENYYLVVTVPKDAGNEALNGSIQMKIDSTIPHRENYKKIKESRDASGNITIVDNHENTASTYQLSNGYQQELNETGHDGPSQKVTLSNAKITVDVTDTITFPNSQAYNPDNDKLYLRFVGGLRKTLSNQVSAEQFPSGTSGEVSFYVYTQGSTGMTYYQYQSTTQTWSQFGSDEVAAVTYPWTSDGRNMELPLSTDGTIENLISLHGVREAVRRTQSGINSTFYVAVKMKAELPPAGLDVIPESSTGNNNLPTDYAKLTFSSQLSTVTQSLTYSSNQATLQEMTTAYYRDEPTGAKLTYDADEMNQLGINLLDLQSEYLDKAKTHSLIDTTATYDLSTMKNLEDTLKTSSGIRFTLTLQPKGEAEGYGTTALSDAERYMSVELKSQDSGELLYNEGTWTWTVPRASYYANGELNESSIFKSDHVLRQSIQLKVNVTNVQEQNHLYSNYKVVLTAAILDAQGQEIQNTTLSDNIIYTFARIVQEFLP